eukprot:GHVS01034319.1.p1 GENE.GHVS01034319.1~~GHVS01034319.1.p1  ORF type:complete len:184 (-),score=33.45 GHVS01034319.1:422-973(-)
MYSNSLPFSPSDSIPSPPSPTLSSPGPSPPPLLFSCGSTSPPPPPRIILSKYFSLYRLLSQLPPKDSCLVTNNAPSLATDYVSSGLKQSRGHAEREWKNPEEPRTEEKKYNYRRDLGDFIVSAWRVQLGEVGRGTIKRLISERLQHGSLCMRDAVKGISRIKAATIEQLIVISSVVGCLKQVS